LRTTKDSLKRAGRQLENLRYKKYNVFTQKSAESKF